MRFSRYLGLLIVAGFALAAGSGCDGKDPQRLQKVAKKLNEKARKSTEDVNLPQITITMPDKKQKPETGNPKQEEQSETK